PATGGRLDLVRAACDEAVLTEPRRRPLDPRTHDPRLLVDIRRAEHDRDDLRAALPRPHVPPPHAVRLERARHELPARARDALPDRRGRAAPLRPHGGDELLLSGRGCRPAALAVPLLVLRAPRGLHHDPARLRSRLRSAAGVLTET